MFECAKSREIWCILHYVECTLIALLYPTPIETSVSHTADFPLSMSSEPLKQSDH